MRSLRIHFLADLLFLLFGVGTVVLYFNATASENTEQAITVMLASTGEYHSAEQFMRIYGVTNAFMPSRLQSYWLADQVISTEKSCSELMDLAMQRGRSITHAHERNAYVRKLKDLEADYWQARIRLTQGHLESMAKLVTSWGNQRGGGGAQGELESGAENGDMPRQGQIDKIENSHSPDAEEQDQSR